MESDEHGDDQLKNEAMQFMVHPISSDISQLDGYEELSSDQIACLLDFIKSRATGGDEFWMET